LGPKRNRTEKYILKRKAEADTQREVEREYA
jgi:hypothetical protein